MPREFSRADRVSAQLRRDIALLVHEAVRSHALPSVSVSDVKVNKEIDSATVFVTALMAEQASPAVKRLNEMAKEIRIELSRMIRMRRVPEIRFEYDDSLDRAERIDTLLRSEQER